MPSLLEPETADNPFSDLIPADIIGGDNGGTAYQVVGGRFGEVPKAEPGYGIFSDLVPDQSLGESAEAGIFADLIPESPTSESEKALSETPKREVTWSDIAKTQPQIMGLGVLLDAGKQALNAISPGFLEHITTPVLTANHLDIKDSDPVAQKIAFGVENRLRDLVSGMSSPAMVATLGAGSVVPALSKPIAGYFLADTAKQLPEAIAALQAAEKTPAGSRERVDAGLNLATLVAFSGLLSKHLTSKPKPQVTPDELAVHARTRIAELEAKPRNPMEQSELDHLQQNADNPTELSRTYGVPVTTVAETEVRPETARYAPDAATRDAEYQAMSSKLDELNKDQFLPEPGTEAAIAEIQRRNPTNLEPFIPVEPPGTKFPEPSSEPNAARQISPELVPEYLRRDPAVERLLSEPDAQTGPQMKMAGAGEGGALFSRGGTRAKVVPKGTTPKGDTQFLRIEPGYKRLASGLERKGAADVLGDTKNKVGQMLAKATRRHVDTEQEIFGQLHSKFDAAVSGPRKIVDAAFDELEPFLAAKENGRSTPVLSPKAQEILTAWEDVAESTGNLARANGVQVFDPALGAHRPIGNLGRNYLPRVMKPEVERVMHDPKQNPALWNTLVDAFARHRGITDVEAAKELRSEAGRFSSTDFMGNLERARTGQLPEIFYDYDLRRVASRYIPSFSERISQIIAYGQRLGPRERPQRPNLWDIARGESENDYTQRWLTSAEDQAVNLRAKTASGVGMARAQTLASGLLLSSPTTSVVRNTLSGLTSTAELMGIRRSLAPLARAMTRGERANAKEMGAVRQDMGDFLHADKLGTTVVDDVVRFVTDKALKFSGYNGSEVFVRTHGALVASQFARDGIAAIVKNPASMRAKEALAMFKRMGVDAQKIVSENADWKAGPETRQFIRTVIRDTQGGYRFDQVPLWANSNMGRFFYQFGRWGTQRARNIWKNGIKPAIGEEVQWNGKTMTRRDIRPLAKMAGSAVLLGEAFAGVASLLFGRDRRDASVAEISQAWDEDKKAAVGLAFERGINDIIMAGTLGIWGQPIDWAKSLRNQSRLKNPMEPPGLGSVNALKELGQAALDQGGDITQSDLLKFAGNIVPGVKQLSDVGRNVYDEPLYEAQNDVRTLRAAAQRWAKREGLDVSPRAKGDFRKSPLAPEYEPIKRALLVGDANTARVLKAEFLNKQKDREKAIESLKASVKASQPFRAGPYTAEEQLVKFQAWARKNLSDADYQQTKRIQERYTKAAQKAGLW